MYISMILPQLIAQSINNPALPGDLGSLSGSEFFGRLIPALLSLALVIGAIIFLFYFLLGAINWITSGGDKMKVEQARNRITTALVGVIILLSFIAVLNLLELFFGIGLREVRVGPFQIYFLGSQSSSSSITCGPGQRICENELGELFCWPGSFCPN